MGDFLTLRNIRKGFVGVQALKRVDFSIGQGEIHCLVGENGSGKSTLIKIISGVLPADEGEIWVEGERITQAESIASIKRGIEVIYQDLSLFPNLSVAENVAMGQLIESGKRMMEWDKIKEIARSAMGRIGLELDLDQPVGPLSVGRKQMVAICRALTSDLRLLILDEPTTALTKPEINNLFAVVEDLQAKGIAVMFVSHKLNEVLEIAERVTVLRDGDIVGTVPREGLTNDTLVEMMTGQNITYTRYESDVSDKPTLLEVRGLSKERNFKEISFSLREGEVLGLAGLLGSGRTELALSLFGMNAPDGGEIVLDGKRVAIKSVQDAVEYGIGYVPENRLEEGLIMDQPVANNIATAVIKRLRKANMLLDTVAFDNLVTKWVKDLGIKVSDPSYDVQTLSGGNQQRVVIAKWLATEPKLLILNGPTVGVDVAAKDAVHELIRGMAEAGVGVIIISDEVPELIANSHRILVMRKGRIVDEMDASTVSEEQLQARVEQKESKSAQL